MRKRKKRFLLASDNFKLSKCKINDVVECSHYTQQHHCSVVLVRKVVVNKNNNKIFICCFKKIRSNLSTKNSLVFTEFHIEIFPQVNT